MRQWHDAMQVNGKPKSAIATTLAVLANLPPGPTGAPTAYLPPDRPASSAPTYASSPAVPDYTYAGPSILTERDSAVDDDDGPPPPRTVITMPMGNGATIIAGDINGIALPMGSGTLYSFE